MNLEARQAQVRLTVNPDTTCPAWRATFQAAGWRPFAKTNTNGLITWLLKRGSSVVAFVQSAFGPLEQVVELPTEAAAELSSLMVTSGLARPA